MFPHYAKPDDFFWLHQTTAFVSPKSNKWEAEFLASFFHRNSGNPASDLAAEVATRLGVAPDDQATRKVIEKRAEAFLNFIIIGRHVDLQVYEGGVIKLPIGGLSGICGAVKEIPFSREVNDGDIIPFKAILPSGWKDGDVAATIRVTEPHGWAIISDIDDTIKHTNVLSIPDVLRNTFVNEPTPTPGMPDFYRQINSLLNPTWFYLSASPYNLYPFLRDFVSGNYTPGHIILRDMSWMDVAGLIGSISTGTQKYKTEEGEKIIGEWLPTRKFICIGDSTQKDPESYAALYHQFPGTVQAIWIRVVSGVDLQKEKALNSPERFQTAFKDIPAGIWKTFTDPGKELSQDLEKLRSSVIV